MAANDATSPPTPPHPSPPPAPRRSAAAGSSFPTSPFPTSPFPTSPLPTRTLTPEPSPRGPFLQFRTPHHFEWNRYTLPLPNLSPALNNLRIVHLTDLHLKAFWSRTYDRLIARVNESHPDLILITGDFVDSKTKGIAATPHARRLVSSLRSRLGTYGILGNHDGDLVAPYLAATPNLHLLDDDHLLFENGLELLATAAVHRDDISFPLLDSLPPKPPGHVRILLTHYPDTLRHFTAANAPDLLLAGHTHGGQICLPTGRPIIRHDSLPPNLCKGVHQVGPTYLVVSRGLGFTSLPVRAFCPAEVVELVLKREDMKT